MALPKLKDIKWVTTDCYGTLIDWEKGIIDAFKKEADRDGFTLRRGAASSTRFFEVQAEIMAGSYELYAEVLRRAAVKVAGGDRLGARALAGPVPARQRRPLAALPRGQRRDGPARRSATRSGSSPTSTTSCSAISRRHLRTELDLVVTAQQVRSYKPDPAHFKECARRIGGKKGWVHIGSRLRDRRRPRC